MYFIASDSSPLISLASIGRFSLLENNYSSIIVPPAVWAEIADDHLGRPGCFELIKGRDCNFVRVIIVPCKTSWNNWIEKRIIPRRAV